MQRLLHWVTFGALAGATTVALAQHAPARRLPIAHATRRTTHHAGGAPLRPKGNRREGIPPRGALPISRHNGDRGGDHDNTGPKVYSATQEKQITFVDPRTGQAHLLLYYVAQATWNTPFQIVDLNLATGHYFVTDGLPGRPGANATIVHPNGKVYIASNDPGYFMEYDPATGTARQIHTLSDKGGQWLQLGDDGALYLGEAIKGTVERYDPATGLWSSLGVMDDPGPPYYRYAYTVGADRRYTYTAVGQSPWYMVVYDRQNGTQQTFWKGLNPAAVNICRGRQGGWYAEVSGLGWFQLLNGQPVATSLKPDVYPWYVQGAACSDIDAGQLSTGYQIDLAKAIPYSSSATPAPATLRWRKVGTLAWLTAQPAVRTVPQALKQLYPGPDGKLFGFTDFYGPLFTYDPAHNQTKLLGNNYRSNYDAVYQPAKHVWYVVGYPGATTRYDPTRSWSLTVGANGSDPKYNPFYLAGMGKYHYYAALGADGWVYVASHHERDSVGGELGWYDPSTYQLSSLRTPFLTQDVSDLKAVLGGSKLVYVSTAVNTGDGARLYVFDVATRTLERQIVPIAAMPSLGKIAEVAPGIVVGIAGTRLYKVDVRTGKTLLTTSLAVTPFAGMMSYNQRLTCGPDGNLWLTVKQNATTYLARVHPDNGAIDLVATLNYPGNVVFVHRATTGYDAFIYGDTRLTKLSTLIP